MSSLFESHRQQAIERAYRIFPRCFPPFLDDGCHSFCWPQVIFAGGAHVVVIIIRQEYAELELVRRLYRNLFLVFRFHWFATDTALDTYRETRKPGDLVRVKSFPDFLGASTSPTVILLLAGELKVGQKIQANCSDWGMRYQLEYTHSEIFQCRRERIFTG